MIEVWNRRRWIMSHALGMTALVPQRWLPHATRHPAVPRHAHRSDAAQRAARTVRHAERLDPALWQRLAQHAVDAARAAGADYADARLTRMVRHRYGVEGNNLHGNGIPVPWLQNDDEVVGIGIRALVGGGWGFSSSAVLAPDEAARLAQDAVGQARENGKGVSWTVELGEYPVATGTWETPHRIDPFTISIEEKIDHIVYWKQCAAAAGVELVYNGGPSWIAFVREEQVVATSEGALFTQTLYESGGLILCGRGFPAQAIVHGIDVAGAGWERLLDANIADQFLSGRLRHEMAAKEAIPNKPSNIGKYTLVCDGATMAAMTGATLGAATQLDRALGYEANASGTSFITDPLAMAGHLQITSPYVTVTASRSAPLELATVQWDAEGVVPEPFTLIKEGVLVDFQTTREQAVWLAPYYRQNGHPVRSHGCAAAESAHYVPIQQMPNLAMAPNPSTLHLSDLVADVPEGILVEDGHVLEIDFQERTGLLMGDMREIRNGRLGKMLIGGAVLFDSEPFWKAITVVGGGSTQAVRNFSPFIQRAEMLVFDAPAHANYMFNQKGEPLQRTSHSVRAVAAIIPNQSLIDPARKA